MYVNMEKELLIAQRFIYDTMKSVNTDAGSFPITKEMRQSREKAKATSST